MRFAAAAHVALALGVVVASTRTAAAQSLGTFTWQLQPYCNVVTVNVIQQGAVYTIDGYDDQCGAPQRAPLTGLATPNPDGTIGFGLNVVTVPGGRGVQIDARISLPAGSGVWTDSAGSTGTFAFAAHTGGGARPIPAVTLLANGGFLAEGQSGTAVIPASGPGTRMMFYPGKAAFRAGNVTNGAWNDADIGISSAALGTNTRASGYASTALGNNTTASGAGATAMGSSTTASANDSLATGAGSTASGAQSAAMGVGAVSSGYWSFATGYGSHAGSDASVAMGLNTIAAGAHAFAMGDASEASGGNSVAVGSFARANGYESVSMGQNTTAIANGSVALGSNASAAGGSFVFGDRSTNNVISTAVANQFAVRAAAGVSFYTNAALTSGVQLSAGGSGWSVVSDARMKENFRELSNHDVLAAIARMPVREWNYTTQDASIRHVGPTAQDFRAAFGLGESDVRINSIDADGVALAAIKALEARTRELAESRDTLAQANETLQRENETVRADLQRLATIVAELRATLLALSAGRHP